MKTQSGRSMIEMLGVLAIIGVLSIGGLAGYTRAMRSNRVNNILDYTNRCWVEVRGSGTGIGDVANRKCANILSEALPTGASAIACARSGSTATCQVTLTGGSTGDLAKAFAAKVNVSPVPSHFTFGGSTWGTLDSPGPVYTAAGDPD
ncbi:MAG: hypothetical protein ILP11_03575 [Alphaproteobacteria bacterium]|nr:hypothetical protein [Alphaproteobacteria bacterium]